MKTNKKNYLKKSNQLGSIATEMFLLNQKETIKNILNNEKKEKIFEKVYKNYRANQKNIIYEFYCNNFDNIISDLNILKEYFGNEIKLSLENLNNKNFVNNVLVIYSLEIAKRECFKDKITIKEFYNFVKNYNDNDEIWEMFYNFLKENEIKRIKETTESILEDIKYFLKTNKKIIPVFKILEEKKKIFNSENDKVVILSKENTYCKKDSILDEMFPYKEFNREKITDNEIIKILEEISEEVENI